MRADGIALRLHNARASNYAIGAFNAVNLETAQAIVEAAEAERAPVILQISENAARYGGLQPLLALSKALKEDADVPVYLHFDHAENFQSALAAIELGFDSVMLEGADLGLKANARQLQRLVEIAHDHGAAIEGEFEIVNKDGREGTRLTPEELRDLSTTSGCDFVAVDVGSTHKQTQKVARIDLQRLKALAELIPQPLVLHGSSGVTVDDLEHAIQLGIAKVNVATELMQSFTQGVRENLTADSYDPRKYLGAARTKMREKVRHIIHSLRSTSKGSAA